MDRRVKKTQSAIRSAFISLIEEKGEVNSITIKEIVERADISRSTFYTHYTDIIELTEDLTNYIADNIGEIVIDAHKKMPGSTSYMVIYTNILTYLRKIGPLTKALVLDGRNNALISSIADSLKTVIAEYYKSAHKHINYLVLDSTATFWTYGIMGLIREWAKNDFDKSPEEMAKLVIQSIDTCSAFFLDK